MSTMGPNHPDAAARATNLRMHAAPEAFSRIWNKPVDLARITRAPLFRLPGMLISVSLTRFRLRVSVSVLGAALGALVAVPAAHAIDWAASVAEASTNNAELTSARSNQRAAEARVQAARSGYFPRVSASADYRDVSGPAVVPGSVYVAGATATQNLFAGFQDVARVEQASANAQVAQIDLVLVRARLSRDLKFAYASLRYVQEAVTLTEAIARRTGENLRLVQLRFEGGRENKGSLLLTQATLKQSQFDNLQARQAIPSVQAQLARALGRATPEGLRAIDDVPVSPPPVNPNFIALAAAVPEYRRAEAQESAARADVRINRSGFYPTLDLYGTYGREGSDWFPDDSRRTVGATLAIPIFNGGRDYYGVEAASAALSAASFTRGDAERSALVRLRQAYAAYVEAIERVQVDEAFLEAATTRADIARSKYASGLMSFEDWDRIENDLIQRQKNLLLSRRDRVTAEANWEQTQGVGVLP